MISVVSQRAIDRTRNSLHALRLLAGAGVVLLLATMSSATTTGAELQAMSETDRRAALTRILLLSGEACLVVDTFYQGHATALASAVWNVRCAHGRPSFGVLIPDNETWAPAVRDCKFMEANVGADCFHALPKR